MHRFTGGDDVNMYTTTSVTSPGRPTLHNSKALTVVDKPFEIKQINKIDDIPGTKTFNKWNKFSTKPQFNAAVDLPESVPRAAPKTRNVPDRQLMITDIDGAQYSASGGMDRTNRCVDPLQPHYKIPSFIAPLELHEAPAGMCVCVCGGLCFSLSLSLSLSLSPILPPWLPPPAAQKIYRDVLKTDDIDGARSNMFARTEGRATRDVLSIADIDGAQADYNGFKSVRTRFEVALNKSKNFGGVAAPVGMTQDDYQPITFPSPLKFSERTTRRSDPVQPVYEVNGLTIQDDHRYTKPKKNPNFVEAGTYSLTTQDIPGATSTNSPNKKERREVRNIMNTSDVQGAQADTVIKSMVTDRFTCPLFPVYKSLDDGTPVPHLVSSLLKKEVVKDPSIRLKKMYETEALKQAAAVAARAAAAAATAASATGTASGLTVGTGLASTGTAAARSGANVMSPKGGSHSPTPQSYTPERSPINTSRTGDSHGGFFSPVRSSDASDINNQFGSSTVALNAQENVPRLSINAGDGINSGKSTARASGGRHRRGSGGSGSSTGRASAAQLSRRDDIDSVRNLP
jgi:hypothetical protein